jgi:hypothetical protein
VGAEVEHQGAGLQRVLFQKDDPGERRAISVVPFRSDAIGDHSFQAQIAELTLDDAPLEARKMVPIKRVSRKRLKASGYDPLKHCPKHDWRLFDWRLAKHHYW